MLVEKKVESNYISKTCNYKSIEVRHTWFELRQLSQMSQRNFILHGEEKASPFVDSYQ